MSSTQPSSVFSARDDGESGSAIAEFVMVSALVALICAAVIQLAFALHVRTTLVDSAGEGARVAALHGATLNAGVERTGVLIDAALPSLYSQNITADYTDLDGLSIVVVHVHAPLPLVGLLGPTTVTATGRAFVE